MKHTSTPWAVSLEPVSSPYGNSLIVQPATEKVGSVGICWGKGNAEFIVKAVNEHAALVAVAEAAMSADVDRHILPDALHVALEKLAAVRAGQQGSEVGK